MRSSAGETACRRAASTLRKSCASSCDDARGCATCSETCSTCARISSTKPSAPSHARTGVRNPTTTPGPPNAAAAPAGGLWSGTALARARLVYDPPSAKLVDFLRRRTLVPQKPAPDHRLDDPFGFELRAPEQPRHRIAQRRSSEEVSSRRIRRERANELARDACEVRRLRPKTHAVVHTMRLGSGQGAGRSATSLLAASSTGTTPGPRSSRTTKTSSPRASRDPVPAAPSAAPRRSVFGRDGSFGALSAWSDSPILPILRMRRLHGFAGAGVGCPAPAGSISSRTTEC